MIKKVLIEKADLLLHVQVTKPIRVYGSPCPENGKGCFQGTGMPPAGNTDGHLTNTIAFYGSNGRPLGTIFNKSGRPGLIDQNNIRIPNTPGLSLLPVTATLSG